MSDELLLSILRMPIDLAMSTDTARVRYWFQGQEAADRIEELHQQILDISHQTANQPIETAPKDGSEILVYFQCTGWNTVRWIDGVYCAWCVDDHNHGPYPVKLFKEGDATHWLPLPKEPDREPDREPA